MKTEKNEKKHKERKRNRTRTKQHGTQTVCATNIKKTYKWMFGKLRTVRKNGRKVKEMKKKIIDTKKKENDKGHQVYNRRKCRTLEILGNLLETMNKIE